MKFNAICGMPRSGSTLLCNLLNQNPRFHASSTSPVPGSLRALSNFWSHSAEVKSDLLHDKEATDAWMANVSRFTALNKYADSGAEVIFDKARHWNHSATLFRHLFPEGKMLVCVRDLRDVFASIEKRHKQNPVLDDAGDPIQLTTLSRADRMFAPQGLLGQHIAGVEDLLRHNYPFVVLVQYEVFSKSPQLVIDRIYAALDEKPFKHDFENVENTATDADAIYLNKFPHEGSGSVKPSETTWQEHVPPDVAGLIMQKFQGYNGALGYR